MRKQSEAKEAQGYRKGAASCASCENFKKDVVPLNRWAGDSYTEDKNKRCGIGGFAVQSTGHCQLFSRKV